MGVRAILRAERSVLGPLCLLFFVTYAYFLGAPAWNQNSRLALTRALVEEGTAIIDTSHHSTGDKSFRDGHFYSDKAPGSSLLAAAPYAALHAVTRVAGGPLPEVEVVPRDHADALLGTAPDPENIQAGDRLIPNQAHRVAIYVCRLATTSVLAVMGLAALYLLLLRQLAGDRRAAVIITAIYGLATPALAYSAALYGHQLCADFLLLALALTILTDNDSGDASRARLVALAAGTCLGWAVLCEYPAAVPVLILVGFAAHHRGRRFAAWVCVGGLPWAGALALYHTVAFGGPLTTGYDWVYLPEFAEGMAVRYGIHAPDPSVLHAILFGSYRGLFFLSPVLLLAMWGLAVQVAGPARLGQRQRPWPRRAVAVACMLVVAFYLTLNSGYYMWDGGAALGPRHCVPMLPLLALGLAPALRAVPRTFWILAGVSAVQLVVATASGPEAPQYGDPLYGFAWQRLLAFDISNYAGSTNLGRLLGLPGPLSLAPLVALWVWLGQQALAAAGERERAGEDASPVVSE